MMGAPLNTDELALSADLIRRQEEDGRAVEAALGALAGVVLAAPPAVPQAGDPWVAACRLAAGAIGETLARLGPPPAEGPGLARLRAILDAGRLRNRRVVLRAGWWRHDGGPLLTMAGERPVVLLPRPRGGYELVDPLAGARIPVTAELAETLSPEALTLYRRLEDAPLDAGAILAFCRLGGGRDLAGLLATGLLTALVGLAVPVVTGLLMEHAIPLGDRGMLGQMVAAMMAAAIGGGIFRLVTGFTVVRLQGRLDGMLQTALVDRLLRLPAPFFKRFAAGDLAQRTLGVHAMRELLSTTVVGALFGLLTGASSLALLLFYNWRLALAALSLVAVAAAVTLTLGRRQVRYERARAEAHGRCQGLVVQLLGGMAKLRAAAAERRAFAAWSRLFAAEIRALTGTLRWANAQQVFQAALPPLASLVIFALAVWLIKETTVQRTLWELAGETADRLPEPMNVADFLAFNAAFGQFLAAATAAVLALTEALGAVPLFERLEPVLTEVPEDGQGRADPGRLQGSVKVVGVTFRYGGESPPALRDVSLDIRPGEFVAVVGPSGSGKSTLLRLLLGFETPGRGEVLYDGQTLAGLDLDAVRRQVGVVLQGARLMSGSMLSNIVGDSAATLDDAWEAARQAGLGADIEAMPMGMHTVLIDGGATLSGGQRQRLLIARALVRRPRLLYLDEATSALDNRTQALVAETLRGLSVTRLAIAHRLSTIMQADRVVVLDRGRIVEDGVPAELLKAGGIFTHLANRQILRGDPKA